VVDRQQRARRPDVWLGCPNLTCLVVGDRYPNDQPDAVREGFTGRTLENPTSSTFAPLVKGTV
jgi:hypothetical protein